MSLSHVSRICLTEEKKCLIPVIEQVYSKRNIKITGIFIILKLSYK